MANIKLKRCFKLLQASAYLGEKSSSRTFYTQNLNENQRPCLLVIKSIAIVRAFDKLVTSIAQESPLAMIWDTAGLNPNTIFFIITSTFSINDVTLQLTRSVISARNRASDLGLQT